MFKPNKWTMFPPLPLVDAGTHLVESVESYVIRLSAITGQSGMSLARFLDEQSGGTPIHNAQIRVAYNGPGAVSARRTGKLEELTGEKLREATFWALSEVLASRSSGLTGTRRAWCPLCLQSDDPLGAPSDRLIWNFSHYSRCSIHGVDIERQCQRCGSPQPYGRPLNRRFNCVACRSSLAHAGARQDRPQFFDWVEQVIEELVIWCASEDSYQIPQSNYQRHIKCLLESRKLDPLKQLCPLLHHDILHFRQRRPTVTTLLNIAALQGVTMLDILRWPEESASDLLFDRLDDFRGIPFPPSAFPKAARKLEKALQALLRSKKTLLPPLSLLCELVASDPTDFKHHYERTVGRYNDALAKQLGTRQSGPIFVNRCFRSAIHLIQTSQVSCLHDLTRSLESISVLPPRLVAGIAQSAIKICRALALA